MRSPRPRAARGILPFAALLALVGLGAAFGALLGFAAVRGRLLFPTPRLEASSVHSRISTQPLGGCDARSRPDCSPMLIPI